MKKHQADVSAGRATLRACKAHAGALTGLLLTQFLLRIIALLPIWLIPAWLPEESAVSGAAGWAVSALLFLFCVFPLRFFTGERLSAYAGFAPSAPKKNAYAAWLRSALLRLLRGLPWAVPFCAGAIWLPYAMEYLPYNVFGQSFERLALLAGFPSETSGLAIRGLMVFASLMAAALILLALGWRRDMPMEYLPARDLGALGDVRAAAKVRARSHGRLLHNTLWNALLTLPAIAAAIAVIVPYLASELHLSGEPLLMLRGILRVIHEPLPDIQLWGLAATALFLYLPLLAIRKMRNAVTVGRLHDEEQRHAAG